MASGKRHNLRALFLYVIGFLGLRYACERRKTSLNEPDTSVPLDAPKLQFRFNSSAPWRYHWENSSDPLCRGFKTQFVGANSTPFYPLTSYPGSGNTWTRYLIESLTGVFTGDIYRDDRLSPVFFGTNVDPREGTTFCVKTHKISETKRPSETDKVILIIRNPFEAFISQYHLKHSGSHTDKVQEIDLDKNVEHAEWLEGILLKWYHRNKYWPEFVNSKKPEGSPVSHHLHILHYEEMVANLQGVMLKLAWFLNFDIDPQRLQCLMKYPEGLYHREPSKTEEPFPFDKFQTRDIMNKICQIHRMLIEFGLPGLPLPLYDKRLREKFYQFERSKPMPSFQCND